MVALFETKIKSFTSIYQSYGGNKGVKYDFNETLLSYYYSCSLFKLLMFDPKLYFKLILS